MPETTSIPIAMPQMGESLAEGTVVRWLKTVGEPVAKDEPLFEISTDKVDTEVPSPVDGVLREILVRAGETVAVGAPVAHLSVPSDRVEAPPRAAASSPPGSAREPAAPGAAGHFRESHAPQLVSFRSRRPSRAASPEPGGADSSGGQVAHDRSYSPAVLDAARRSGVPLATLTASSGSGRGGRLTKRDIERYLHEAGRGAGLVAAGAASGGEVPPAYRYRPGPDDERVPMSPVRRQIAHHMTWSTRISPHATAFAEVDMSRTSDMLAARREPFAAQVGAPLTYTVLVAKAATAALGEFRTLNASVVDDSIVLKPAVHLGVAVALPDTDDLIVPVVRNADGLSISGLARAIDDLARRARARRLRPDDVQGGTFTLTNPGMFGGLGGTPIINQPQVAILGLGTIVKRPVVVDDAIAIRPIVMLSLTFDHRAADGMLAFRYLDAVRRRLEAGPDAGEW